MGRLFEHVRLTRESCAGLREVMRPFARMDSVDNTVQFCERLYAAFYSLEADPDKEVFDFRVSPEDVMLINNFVSAEDGDWAADLLHQSRQALHELRTGTEAVRLAPSEQTSRLLAGIHLDPDEPKSLSTKE
jgi:hypothetical protein